MTGWVGKKRPFPGHGVIMQWPLNHWN